MQKGSIALWLIGIVILIVVIVFIFFSYRHKVLQNTALYPLQQTSVITNKNFITTDTDVKENVNQANVSIRRYHADFGQYPTQLSDLKKVWNVNENQLNSFLKTPYKYQISGDSFKFYATLSSGEVYSGDQNYITNMLDATVKVDVNNFLKDVNVYYSNNKTSPATLSEIYKLPEYKDLVYPRDPITNNDYTYTPDADGTRFEISGTLSNGSEYKQQFSIK